MAVAIEQYLRKVAGAAIAEPSQHHGRRENK